MHIQPVGNNVLAEFVEHALSSGIVIPDNSVESVKFFRVVAIGEPRVLDNGERIPIPVKVGDEIILHPNGAYPLTPKEYYGDKKYVMVDVSTILAVITRDQQDLMARKPIVTPDPNAVAADAANAIAKRRK